MLEQNPDAVKIVFKHFPLGFHKQAQPAALAAIAAHNQGKFWQYHDKLYENHKNLHPQIYEAIATELGLDIAVFNKDRQNPQTRQQMLVDMQIGKKSGVSGTPAIFINGHRVKKRSPEIIQQMIDKELERLK